MSRWLLRRLAASLPVLLGVSCIAYALAYLLPGDPARSMAGERYREEDLTRIRHELGLDRPLPVQYAHYMSRLLHGDFGRSFATGRPVLEEIGERFPRTLLLAVGAMAVATILGVGLGTLAAWRPGSWIDRLAMLFALGGISVPVFVSAILLLWVFALQLRLVPPTGYVSADPRAWILPALTLGLRSAAVIARMTRTTVLETLGRDHIRTGRAKGLAEPAVLLRHGLRNALIPILTLIGLDFGSYLSGSVLTESIFAWPGIGQYALQAILRRDFPAIQGTVLFLALVFVFVNLAVDLLYGILDPRIRRGQNSGGSS